MLLFAKREVTDFLFSYRYFEQKARGGKFAYNSFQGKKISRRMSTYFETKNQRADYR